MVRLRWTTSFLNVSDDSNTTIHSSTGKVGSVQLLNVTHIRRRAQVGPFIKRVYGRE